MKRLCDVVIAISTMVILAVAFGLGVQYAERKEAEFNKERNAHVLATWGEDGCTDPNHTCEYGDWCTKSYADFLRRNRKK